MSSKREDQGALRGHQAPREGGGEASVGLFAQARAAGLDLQGLGERIMARKQQLLTQFEGGNLPPPETRSFTGHKMRQGRPVDGGTQATK